MVIRTLRSCLPVVFPIVLLGLAGAVSQAKAQAACEKARDGHITLFGEVGMELSIPFTDLRDMPRQTAEATVHDGSSATFEGVTLREVATRAGVPTGLEGSDLLRYLVVEAADGYQALFSLYELETGAAGLPMLADTRDGTPISPERGPVRVVVPADAGHARWARQVVCIRFGHEEGTS